MLNPDSLVAHSLIDRQPQDHHRVEFDNPNCPGSPTLANSASDCSEDLTERGMNDSPDETSSSSSIHTIPGRSASPPRGRQSDPSLLSSSSESSDDEGPTPVSGLDSSMVQYHDLADDFIRTVRHLQSQINSCQAKLADAQLERRKADQAYVAHVCRDASAIAREIERTVEIDQANQATFDSVEAYKAYVVNYLVGHDEAVAAETDAYLAAAGAVLNL